MRGIRQPQVDETDPDQPATEQQARCNHRGRPRDARTGHNPAEGLRGEQEAEDLRPAAKHGDGEGHNADLKGAFTQEANAEGEEHRSQRAVAADQVQASAPLVKHAPDR